MSSYKNLFPGVTSEITTAPIAAGTDGISLRDEMISILTGTGGEIPYGQNFILRRMRTDSNGDLIECECVDSITKEPDIDYPCTSCRSEGYLWDEELVTGYKVSVSSQSSARTVELVKSQFGVLELPAIVFYFAYLTEPTIKDRIVVIELDLEGVPVLPYNRLASYEINLLRDLRGENGRVEYWACYCSSQNIKTQANLP
jgi:hypothetical protein